VVNGPRADVLDALSLVQETIALPEVQGAAVVKLCAAAAALRRADTNLTPACAVCDDAGCPYCPAAEPVDNVIRFPGFAVSFIGDTA